MSKVTATQITNCKIIDARFNRFDEELIDRYFNEKGKKEIQGYVAGMSIGERKNELEMLPITGIIGMNGKRVDCVLAENIYVAINILSAILELKEVEK